MNSIKQLTILVIAVCLLSSCKKDQVYNETIDQDQKVEFTNKSEEFPSNSFEIVDGRIVLENEESLNELMEQLELGIESYYSLEESEYSSNFEFLDSWESSVGFQSHRSTFLSALTSEQFDALEELPIPDDVLSSVLNADGIVEVKPWIFKLDGELEKVYVIDSEQTDLLSSLIENPEDIPEIQKFSFEDDVFAILNEEFIDSDNNLLDPCRDAKANKDEDSAEGWIGNDCSEGSDYKYLFRLKYRRLGIWCKLYFKFKHKKDNFWSNGRNVSLDFIADAIWFPRCRDGERYLDLSYDRCEDDPVNFASMPHVANHIHETKFYRNTRRLSSYYAYVEVRFTNRCVSPTCCGICQPDYAILDAGARCISDNLSNPYCN